MKKLVIIFATLGLMFQIAGCHGKKTQDDTQVVENADVEKVEAEEANFTGSEATVSDTGPVDESLQAALGETPQVDAVATAPTTESINTETTGTDIAAAPALDENSLAETPVTPSETDATATAQVDAGISETPTIETPTPAQDVAQADVPPADIGQTDAGLAPETTAAADTALAETPIAETPVTPSENSNVVSESAVTAAATSEASAPKATTAANAKGLRKIAETTPYPHGEGYVNTVYIARPKEKLKDISNAIYGMDKTKELKAINSFLKGRGPKAGEKIYYVSPNRPTDATRTLSYYEDTGMIASTYVAEKGDTLPKVAKKLLGYDNAWKEMWTTNSVDSKGKLAVGETLHYWKPAEQKTTLAHNEGNSKLIESAQQLPTQNVAANVPPPQAAAPPPPPAQELPPPPPPPTQEVAAAPQPPAQELPPPPAQELPPPPPPADPSLAANNPPPPPQEVAAAPVPPKQKAGHNMEEEPAAEEGAMNSETTMMIGVVVVLFAVLAMVLVRRNKKKREADMASIEQTHVGS